jgi:hypothetical protein
VASETAGTTVGIALLMASTIPNNYTGVLPSGMTIKRFAHDYEDRRELTRAMVQGTALSLVEIAGATVVAKSWFVAFAGLGVMVFYLWYYYEAMNNPHPDNEPIDQQDSNA